MFKNKISLPSARDLISLVCDFAHDEEKNSRLEILSNTYCKGLDGQKVKGASQLQEVLISIHNSNKIANDILGKVAQVIQIDHSSNGK